MDTLKDIMNLVKLFKWQIAGATCGFVVVALFIAGYELLCR